MNLSTYGVGWATKLESATFKSHFITENQVKATSRTLNYNACRNHDRTNDFYIFNQKAIKIEENVSTSGTNLGVVRFDRNRPDIQGPARALRIIIYVKVIDNAIRDHNTNNPNDQKDVTLQINKTIGHEIGHVLGLPEVNKRSIGWSNFRFRWENTSQEQDFSDTQFGQKGRSLMMQGLYHASTDNYREFHDSQYYVKPGSILGSERIPVNVSTLPNFDTFEFDTQNTPYQEEQNNQNQDRQPPGDTNNEGSQLGNQGGNNNNGRSDTGTDSSGGTGTGSSGIGTRSSSGGGGTSTGTGSSSTGTTNPPPSPTDLRVSAGDGQVSLSWTAPSDTSITDYEYRYRVNGTLTWGDWISTGSTSTSKDVTGLTNGTTYEFEVRSVKGTRQSSESNAVTETPRAPIIVVVVPAPVWSDIPDPYNLTVGDSFSLDLSSYVTGSPTITKTSGRIPAGLSFSSGVLSGTVTGVEDRDLQFTATNTGGSAESEWVNIVVTAAPTPTVSAPVWSDIPDPYNLTVGDSFSLDLSSYVTGSPTITKTSGRIPAGLSFSNGVLSGTVTSVESRGIRFTATNSAGSADSEYVNIVITAQ
ncbi:MAG: fibronectin type III domain-containing protein [Candidatus Poribacteria bacterium]|nr:fibronectin type III domain-containing protein [Candidatus Poribacteria bacterium]